MSYTDRSDLDLQVEIRLADASASNGDDVISFYGTIAAYLPTAPEDHESPLALGRLYGHIFRMTFGSHRDFWMATDAIDSDTEAIGSALSNLAPENEQDRAPVYSDWWNEMTLGFGRQLVTIDMVELDEQYRGLGYGPQAVAITVDLLTGRTMDLVALTAEDETLNAYWSKSLGMMPVEGRPDVLCATADEVITRGYGEDDGAEMGQTEGNILDFPSK